MQKKLLDNIFLLFFRAQSADEGSGLGLSLIYGIIESLGEDLKVKTKEQEGAEFIILLPIA